MIAVTGFKARRAKSNALPRMKTSTTIGVRKRHATEDGNPKKMRDGFHLSSVLGACLRAKVWMTSTTSCGWLTSTSTRSVAQSRSALVILITLGKRANAFTAIPSGCGSRTIVLRDERLVLLSQCCAWTICTGIGARGQHLREQGIGIEGDGREQLFEFFVGERVVCRRLFILSSGRRRDGRENRRLG